MINNLSLNSSLDLNCNSKSVYLSTTKIEINACPLGLFLFSISMFKSLISFKSKSLLVETTLKTKSQSNSFFKYLASFLALI